MIRGHARFYLIQDPSHVQNKLAYHHQAMHWECGHPFQGFKLGRDHATEQVYIEFAEIPFQRPQLLDSFEVDLVKVVVVDWGRLRSPDRFQITHNSAKADVFHHPDEPVDGMHLSAWVVQVEGPVYQDVRDLYIAIRCGHLKWGEEGEFEIQTALVSA